MTTADLAALRARLAIDEGDRDYPYDDATGKRLLPGDTLKGNLTVGTGYNLTARPLSARVRALLLDECLDECLIDLMSFPWFNKLDAVRQRAVVNFRFNVGRAGFRGFPKFIDALSKEDYLGACFELTSAKWAHQVQSSRVQAITEMLKTGSAV